jgi:predicted amidohydrolase YtcJ
MPRPPMNESDYNSFIEDHKKKLEALMIEHAELMNDETVQKFVHVQTMIEVHKGYIEDWTERKKWLPKY